MERRGKRGTERHSAVSYTHLDVYKRQPLKVRNSGLKVKQKQLDESPLKVRNSGLKVKQKQLDESLIERSLSHAKDSKNSP